MSEKSKSTTTGRKLSRAELKAYRSRREAERRRIAAAQAEVQEQATKPQRPIASGSDTSYMMTRDEEFMVIRQDLYRLLIIVAVLLVLLAVATVILR